MRAFVRDLSTQSFLKARENLPSRRSFYERIPENCNTLPRRYPHSPRTTRTPLTVVARAKTEDLQGRFHRGRPRPPEARADNLDVAMLFTNRVVHGQQEKTPLVETGGQVRSEHTGVGGHS